VLHCPGCRRLVEISALPARGEPVRCPDCATRFDWARGPARRNRYRCGCGAEGRYPDDVTRSGQPRHRLYGIEYHCADCRQATPGRLFKTPDDDDRDRVRRASNRLARAHDLDLPGASIPDGDETRRLHRWGYQRWRDLFSPRQQLALGLLRQRIAEVDDTASRHALATVFSDALRYQNLLCRYDTYALKCQDVFAVHGFPVAPLACENNVLGIPGIGSGGFRHFVQKYERAKAWCAAPTETRVEGGRREKIPMPGERIAARLTRSRLKLGPVEAARLRPATVDAVFTDPPYFDNLQYAELMDFCWVWLRPLIADALPARTSPDTTRTPGELTGNTHLGKGLPHFTDGLARTFGAAAAALRPGGPFAFTWHHNDPDAYLAIIVGVLDAGLHCTATLPAPGEMTASLHIQGTRSATVDTVFVCRHTPPTRSLRVGPATLARWIDSDVRDLRRAGLRVTDGDRHCLTLGHLARVTIQRLRGGWNAEAPVAQRLASAREVFERERHASGGALP
jgi:adenine-specific DNA methylase